MVSLNGLATLGLHAGRQGSNGVLQECSILVAILYKCWLGDGGSEGGSRSSHSWDVGGDTPPLAGMVAHPLWPGSRVSVWCWMACLWHRVFDVSWWHTPFSLIICAASLGSVVWIECQRDIQILSSKNQFVLLYRKRKLTIVSSEEAVCVKWGCGYMYRPVGWFKVDPYKLAYWCMVCLISWSGLLVSYLIGALSVSPNVVRAHEYSWCLDLFACD